MSKVNGTILKAYVEGSPDKKIANLKDISFSINAKEIDVTDDDSGGYAEYIVGLRGWSGKATQNVDLKTPTGKAGTKELVEYVIGREPIAIAFTTLLTGDVAFSGTVIFLDVSPSRSAEGAITATVDLLGTGPITLATIA